MKQEKENVDDDNGRIDGTFDASAVDDDASDDDNDDKRQSIADRLKDENADFNFSSKSVSTRASTSIMRRRRANVDGDKN
jgi:hypothetical protein